MIFSKKNLLIVFFTFCTLASGAWHIKGKVTDTAGNPLPYATIMVEGTTNGIIANSEGAYIMQLLPGSYTLVYKFIGYKTHKEKIDNLFEDIIIDVTLMPEQYDIGAVEVTAGGENPAMEIMRQAIKMRRTYLNEVESFACDVYIKGLQRLKAYPKKMMGVKIDFGGQLDSTTGIFYLSESVSQYNFRRPNDRKEVMISSKVSGRSKAFSFNRASQMAMNLYENNITMEGLSPRGIVSPLADNAMLYYRYELEGSFVENNMLIYKIELLPRREHDPVFRGHIFITDNTWRLHSADLMLIKEAQIQFVDTIWMKQLHMPVNAIAKVWMPVSTNYFFCFNFLGFKGDGNFEAAFSNYEIEPEFDKNFFNGAEVKVNEGSNNKDDEYWYNIRPVPLTAIEKEDYRKRDSAEVIIKTKEYNDSLDRRDNAMSPLPFLLYGYSYRKRFYKTLYTISSPIRGINFNTVEGWNIAMTLGGYKNYSRHRRLSAAIKTRFAFATQDLLSTAYVSYRLNKHKSALIEVGGGRDFVQYDDHSPLTAFANTVHTLLGERNYMKLFEKKMITFRWEREIINGVFVSNVTEYAKRQPLVNNDLYTLIDKPHITYTSNNPLKYSSDAYAFKSHEAIKNNFILRLRYKQKFYSDPENYYNYGSKYPTLSIRYILTHAMYPYRTYINQAVATLDGDFNLFLLGKLQWQLQAAKTFGKRPSLLSDYFHFNANQTLFSGFDINDFQLLPYYTYSTNDRFVQAHFENNFGGFLFNKIPFLRKALLNEIVGLHYLYTPANGHYAEASVGIEKIRLLRIAYTMRVWGDAPQWHGLQIGLLLNRGE